MNKTKKLYINLEDYQNGGWFVGVYGTLKQWRNQAMEWCDMDENYEIYNLLKYYKIKNCDLLYFINDYWTIGIEEFNPTIEYDLELTSL